MAVFKLREPLRTTEPSVTVDAGLPAGRYRFQLVVVDESGNQSEPQETIVTVVQRTTPPTGPGGQPNIFRRLLNLMR